MDVKVFQDISLNILRIPNMREKVFFLNDDKIDLDFIHFTSLTLFEIIE